MSLFLWCLDYIGVAIMIVSSFVPPIYYAFLYHPLAGLAYLSTISALGLATAAILLIPAFSTLGFRHLQARLFFATGFFGFMPTVHALVLNWEHRSCHVVIALELAMGAYAAGAGFYMSRVPERFWPGAFDLVGRNHQIFHAHSGCSRRWQWRAFQDQNLLPHSEHGEVTSMAPSGFFFHRYFFLFEVDPASAPPPQPPPSPTWGTSSPSSSSGISSSSSVFLLFFPSSVFFPLPQPPPPFFFFLLLLPRRRCGRSGVEFHLLLLLSSYSSCTRAHGPLPGGCSHDHLNVEHRRWLCRLRLDQRFCNVLWRQRCLRNYGSSSPSISNPMEEINDE